jgi:uridine kinase
MTIIAFITGLPGSGKTYLGHKIKKKFKNMKVLDTDKLKDDFLKNNNKERLELANDLSNFPSFGQKSEEQKDIEYEYNKLYKIHLTKKMKKFKNSKTNYVIVGQFFLFDYLYHSVPAKLKYFLNVDPETTFIRRNKRWLINLNKNKKYFGSLINKGEEFWNYNKLWNFSNFEFIDKEYIQLKNFYKKKGFRMGLNEKILNHIEKILK